MNDSFPASLESLNCDWLSRVLKENGTLSCGCVVIFWPTLISLVVNSEYN
jgi:hypothetical protein